MNFEVGIGRDVLDDGKSLSTFSRGKSSKKRPSVNSKP